MIESRNHIYIFYHFFEPDDVVSARLYSQLAADLVQRGWTFTAFPCNRSCHGSDNIYPSRTAWQQVSIHRIWRPAFSQSSFVGRLFNSIWMLFAWSIAALMLPKVKNEIVIIGTDPIFSVLLAIPWKLIRRHSRIVHWCFDLYPETAIADGIVNQQSPIARIIHHILCIAYRRCSLIVDLGSCMRERLAKYQHGIPTCTITPWALIEPPALPIPDAKVRHHLFGDAHLALLYSGTIGRAHSYDEFLRLARQLRNHHVYFCFAGRGYRSDELRATVDGSDTNIQVSGFATENELHNRLAACDIHMVSLRDDWTGTVVPSKFFGALAVGRPVLFAGSPESSVAHWIREHRVGWVLSTETHDAIATALIELCQNPTALRQLQQHCHDVYTRYFSRKQMVDIWHDELMKLHHSSPAK